MIFHRVCFFFFLFAAFTLEAAQVRVLAADRRQLLIEWSSDSLSRREVRSEFGRFEALSFEGADFIGEIGAPRLPIKSVLIGLPPEGIPQITILEDEQEIVSGILPAPTPRLERSETGVREVYEADPQAYAQNEALFVERVRLDEPYRFRDQRVAALRILPVSFLPARQQIIFHRRMVIRIDFPAVIDQPPAPPTRDEEVYQTMLLNYEQARSWRKTAEPPLRKATMSQFAGENWVKIVISAKNAPNREGIYKLTGATLKQVLGGSAPLAEIDPSTLQLFNNGGKPISTDVVLAKNDTLIETPIAVVGDQDGRFDESDYILFYGRSVEGIEHQPNKNRLVHYINPYTYDNCYWLTFNKRKGKRIKAIPSQEVADLPPQPSFRDLAWIEEERLNVYKSGITWLGRELTRSNNAYSGGFKMPFAVPQDEATFRFGLASVTSGTHYFTFYANGNYIGQYSQYGSPYSFPLGEVVLSASGVLMTGDNTVTINYSAASDASFSYVDFIEVEYNRRFESAEDQLLFFAPLSGERIRYQLRGFKSRDVRVFDVTSIGDIREIIPASTDGGVIDFADYGNPILRKRYAAAAPGGYKSVEAAWMTKQQIAGLRNRALRAEYIIITHNDFYQQALQLESLRENWNPKDRLETEVVSYTDVINEFGWGQPEPAAIRNFLAWAQDHWGGPRYVLLIGDGHFDYKNILRQNAPNLIIPFETEGTSENNTRTTDDWYTYTRGDNAGMQMAIGRLVVQSIDEAQAVVNKIVQYETNPDYGEWLKTITIIADDEYTERGDNETVHTEQAERLAETYVPELLHVKKIYMINYPAIKTASISGREKPKATLELLEQINRGSLIINYIGHGNDELWAHERVLMRSRDMEKIRNGRRTALWVAATCEFAFWDQPRQQSFAEDILNAAGRGAIAMISSARLAFSDQNAAFNYQLYRELFTYYPSSGVTRRLGDAVMLAKAAQWDKRNSEKYALLGDPAMRLCTPRYRAVIESMTPDSIQALSRMTISGRIEDQGRRLDDYEGRMLVRVLDTRKQYTYKSEGGSQIPGLFAEGNTLFRGVVKIEQGKFRTQLIVPKDISYGGADGRISLYFWNDESSGAGIKTRIPVGGTSTALVDTQGPVMAIDFGKEHFVPGDYVGTRPTLRVIIEDTLSGINTAGDIGHQILLTLDNDFAASRDITEYFTYDEGSFTRGSLHYPLFDLTPGEHTLLVKAWDNSNNSSIIETYFKVLDESQLEIRNLINYPNPMERSCTFHFELSRDAEVSLKIYTIAGRLIKKLPAVACTVGYNVYPEAWDGRDEDGDSVANGVYFYKLTARARSGDKTLTAEMLERLVVVR